MTVSFNLFNELFNETLPIIEDDYGIFATDSESHRRRILAGCIKTLLTRERFQLLRRLSHFVAAIHQQGLNYIELLFVTPVSSSTISHCFSGADQIHAHYSDGSSFCIYCGSTPELIYTANAFAELLELPALQALCDRIGCNCNDRNQVDQIAREWSDQFDAYRRRRGGSSHKEKQFKSIVAFCDDQFDGGRYSPRDIGPDQLLGYWQTHWADPQLNVQRYQKVHQLLVLFVDSFASHLNQTAASEPGLLDDNSTDETVLSGVSGADDWTARHTGCEPIRFLLGTGLNSVGFFIDLPYPAHHLMLSALRAHCFAPLENRMINARRGPQAEALIAGILQQLQGAELPMDYQAILQRCNKTSGLFRRSVQASIYHLIVNENSDGLRLLYLVSPQLGGRAGWLRDLTRMGITVPELEEDQGDLSAVMESIYRSAYRAIAHQNGVPPELNDAITHCKQAWQACTQSGFSRKDRDDPLITDLLSQASDRFIGALTYFEQCHRQLLEQVGDVEQQQTFDLTTMHEIFKTIYQPQSEAQPS
ncbi:MAG: hypothetical protein CMK79_12385 [Pseudomonadales bacterium]|nr:hypothetical protein [Pseudomonadales bacterium]